MPNTFSDALRNPSDRSGRVFVQTTLDGILGQRSICYQQRKVQSFALGNTQALDAIASNAKDPVSALASVAFPTDADDRFHSLAPFDVTAILGYGSSSVASGPAFAFTLDDGGVTLAIDGRSARSLKNKEIGGNTWWSQRSDLPVRGWPRGDNDALTKLIDGHTLKQAIAHPYPIQGWLSKQIEDRLNADANSFACRIRNDVRQNTDIQTFRLEVTFETCAMRAMVVLTVRACFPDLSGSGISDEDLLGGLSPRSAAWMFPPLTDLKVELHAEQYDPRCLIDRASPRLFLSNSGCLAISSIVPAGGSSSKASRAPNAFRIQSTYAANGDAPADLVRSCPENWSPLETELSGAQYTPHTQYNSGLCPYNASTGPAPTKKYATTFQCPADKVRPGQSETHAGTWKKPASVHRYSKKNAEYVTQMSCTQNKNQRKYGTSYAYCDTNFDCEGYWNCPSACTCDPNYPGESKTGCCSNMCRTLNSIPWNLGGCKNCPSTDSKDTEKQIQISKDHCEKTDNAIAFDSSDPNLFKCALTYFQQPWKNSNAGGDAEADPTGGPVCTYYDGAPDKEREVDCTGAFGGKNLKSKACQFGDKFFPTQTFSSPGVAEENACSAAEAYLFQSQNKDGLLPESWPDFLGDAKLGAPYDKYLRCASLNPSYFGDDDARARTLASLLSIRTRLVAALRNSGTELPRVGSSPALKLWSDVAATAHEDLAPIEKNGTVGFVLLDTSAAPPTNLSEFPSNKSGSPGEDSVLANLQKIFGDASWQKYAPPVSRLPVFRVDGADYSVFLSRDLLGHAAFVHGDKIYLAANTFYQTTLKKQEWGLEKGVDLLRQHGAYCKDFVASFGSVSPGAPSIQKGSKEDDVFQKLKSSLTYDMIGDSTSLEDALNRPEFWNGNKPEADTLNQVLGVLKTFPVDAMPSNPMDLVETLRASVERGENPQVLDVAGRYLDPVCNLKTDNSNRSLSGPPTSWSLSPLDLVSFQQVGSSMQPGWAVPTTSDAAPYTTDAFDNNRTIQLINATEGGATQMIQNIAEVASTCQTCYSNNGQNGYNLMRINNEEKNFTGRMGDAVSYGKEFCAECSNTANDKELNLAQYATSNFAVPETINMQICSISIGGSNLRASEGSQANTQNIAACSQTIQGDGGTQIENRGGNIISGNQNDDSSDDSSGTRGGSAISVPGMPNLPDFPVTSQTSDDSDNTPSSQPKSPWHYTYILAGGIVAGLVIIGIIVGLILYFHFKKKT